MLIIWMTLCSDRRGKGILKIVHFFNQEGNSQIFFQNVYFFFIQQLEH